MEKINIAKLLKDCPRGMELNCTSYDNVSFDKISADKKATYPIFCYITDEKGNRSSISFTEDGCESKRYGAKCVIFPKGKNTWKGFIPPCKFKVGDRIIKKDGIYIFDVVLVSSEYYTIQGFGSVYEIPVKEQDNFELAPNKFDINTLKPFESKVLVRDTNTDEWRGHFFSHYDSNSDRPYVCIGVEGINEYKRCIPYEGNEHLLGKTDDCSSFYKTWSND